MAEPFVAPAGWQPPPARPPLTPRAKRGASLAGIIGFLLLSLGFAVFGIPLALLAFGAFFALIVGLIRRSTRDPDLGGFMDFVDRLDPGAWILPLVAIAVLGLAIIVAALFVSAGILRSHGISRPWGVTWAGAGIAIVASWLVSSVLSIPLQFGRFFGDGDSSAFPGVVVLWVLSGLAGVVVTAAVGWLSWWWMAHVMRP